MSEASVAKPNVDGRELVTCDEHHTRRMAKFCTPVPVYNADHEIISYVFHCKEDQMCSSAMQRAKRQNDSNVNDQQSQSHTGTTKDNEHHFQPVIYSGGSSTITTKHTQRTKPFTNDSITLDNNANSSSNPSKNSNTSTYFSVSFTKSTNDNNDDTKSNENNSANKIEETIVIKKKNSISKSTKINSGDTIDDDYHDAQLSENDSSSEHDSSSSAHTDNEKKEDLQENNVKLRMSNYATSEKKDVQLLPTPSPVTVKGPIRYYDLIQRAMTGNINNINNNNSIVGGSNNNNNYFNHNKGSNRYNCKHMCWLCGLAGHEKPECPNMLCRTCHTPRPSRQMHHICAPTKPSEFIFPPDNLPEQEEDGMAAVRCLFCGEFGHFDCHDPLTAINTTAITTTTTITSSSTAAGATDSGVNGIANKDLPCAENVDKEHIYKTRNEELSCCFCGRRGHTTFNCNEREHVNPDRWIQRMQSVYYSNYSNNNNSNRSMWREERMQNTSFNNNYNNSNTFDRRINNSNSNSNNNNNFDSSNNNSINRFNRTYLSNSNSDKPSTLGVMRSEWRGTEQRKRFRSSEADDNANNRQYNNNNNYNNNNEDEREHAQWLRQFRDNTSQQSTSFPTREFSIERSQQRRVNQYHRNNYQNNKNTNNNSNYNHRSVNQRNNYNNSFSNNRFMRQDYTNQSKYNINNNNNNSNNNYQRREDQFQNNAGMHRRRRAKPHEYDSDEDDLY